MKNSYKNTFDQIYSLEPSQKMVSRINANIEHHVIIRSRAKALAYGLLTMTTLLIFIPVFQYTNTQAISAGFYEYVSLFSSDSLYMIQNWKITTLSILESLPMLGTILMLGIILVSIYAFKKSFSYTKLSYQNLLAQA